MKYLVFALSYLFTIQINAQSFEEGNAKHRKEMDEQFRNVEESPLTKKDFKKFKGLEYFPLNEKYAIKAKFTLNPNPQIFQMPTSTTRLPLYSTYGELTFEVDGEEYKLQVYQNQRLKNQEGYEDYLFIPFSDDTNAVETYGGGRYLDFRIPESDTVTIDFNKAYNPYCAYSDRYSCPKVPSENQLPIRIEAGVLNWDH